MGVLICYTSDRRRVVVSIDDVVVLDTATSPNVCLMDEMDMVDAYVRQGLSVTVATLPPGIQPRY